MSPIDAYGVPVCASSWTVPPASPGFDYFLPSATGLEVARQLGAIDAEAPVIFLPAHA